MSQVAIHIDNISKLYRVGGRASYHTLQESIVNIVRKPFSDVNAKSAHDRDRQDIFWALKNVSFDVMEGDVVGIIGMNGAGKSTLLKILSKIIPPTEGGADIYGRVGSLLEVGTGFHPELTGRENVFFSGAMLGMSSLEIRAKFDDIVEFSEIGKFIDTPLKHYSSGMQVRLAFSVAAHLEPEILMIDEVLAVGDLAFQKKCLGKMNDISQQGRTILFVSHNMGAVQDLCNKGVLLGGGEIKAIGETRSVIDTYVKLCTKMSGDVKFNQENDRHDDGFKFTAIRILDKGNEPVAVIDLESGFTLEIDYMIAQPQKSMIIAFELWGAMGACIFSSTDLDAEPSLLREVRLAGRYSVKCFVPTSYLRPGYYWIDITASIPNVKVLDIKSNAISFEINGLNVENNLSQGRRGTIIPILEWKTVRKG
jgi:lipopolysaccharide transport system ATP-binding protein